MSSPNSDEWMQNPLFRAARLDEQSFPKGALYVVGLPIGNLGDITLRALWLLARADVVAAEDTRQTLKLLQNFGISVKLISVREHNEASGAEQIIRYLADGETVALVTDAGTPGVSDPGARAVKAVREAGYRVIPLPGASAAVTALSAAGLDGEGFCFAGFMPPQDKARRAKLAYWAARPEPFVLYEAPHRILDLLNELAEAISPDRRVVIAREITKKFETFTALTGGELKAFAAGHKPQGEYAVVVDEEPKREEKPLSEETRRWLGLLEGELPASRLAAVAAKAAGRSRDEMYRLLMDRKKENG
ncbi:MAG: Ribosomal RNA small subunit methyltransferase I [Burkholderia sp.]|jgi:16S rRNA (cytidine1402-2'-O)-methyltransferase